MNAVLWFGQVVLALAFLGAGYDQAVNYDDARRRLAWVSTLPRPGAVVLGALEIAAAIGLVLPPLIGVEPWLAAAAAFALAGLMAVAAVFHVSRREIPQLAFSGTFLVVAALVALGRIFIAPF